MSYRPTHEVTTGDYTLILNDYITGEENRQIRAIYIRSLKASEPGQDVAAIEFEADNKAIELAVVSVEGPNLPEGSIVERVLAMPLANFKEAVSSVAEVVEAKKKSETSSPNTPATL